MKEIIYNNDCLADIDINRYIKRAKIIIENSKNEILLAYSHKNYFLLGGHVENNESFDECIVREIKEETGIEIPYKKRIPYFSIKYLCKNYPNESENTKYITNYYFIKLDLIPNLKNIKLTEDEKEGNFKLQYIAKNSIIKILTDSLNTCTNTNVVQDTIDAIKEYLTNNWKNNYYSCFFITNFLNV